MHRVWYPRPADGTRSWAEQTEATGLLLEVPPGAPGPDRRCWRQSGCEGGGTPGREEGAALAPSSGRPRTLRTHARPCPAAGLAPRSGGPLLTAAAPPRPPRPSRAAPRGLLRAAERPARLKGERTRARGTAGGAGSPAGPADPPSPAGPGPPPRGPTHRRRPQLSPMPAGRARARSGTGSPPPHPARRRAPAAAS